MRSLPLQQPLSEAETGLLARRLAASTSHGALSLEGVDGLFCALVAAPVLVLPSDYLPVIFGDGPAEGGAFRDLADAQETMSLLTRYWNSIAHDFEHETVHLAYLEEPAIDGISGRAWARGYLRGTRLAPEGWNRIFRDEREALLLTIPAVAGEVDPAWPSEPLTRERSDELLQHMFAGAARAYRYFKQDRLSHARAAEPSEPYERTGPKFGRNAPCPCGSGKKYKRCCGSAASKTGSLH